MSIIIVRTLILYLVVLIAIRIMGKSELSSMDPFQIVILFMMAELAAIPIDTPDSSLIYGVGAIFTLLFLQVVISLLCLKSEKMRVIFSGKPSVLINNGQINKEEMANQRINLDDLNEQLRLKNAPSIADVDYAILEANGDLSVITKPEKRPLTPSDLNIEMAEEIVPVVLISDGQLYEQNLRYAGFEEKKLQSAIKKAGFQGYEDIFLCLCDEKKNFHIYENNKRSANDKLQEIQDKKEESPYL